jgi:hypothetical protein
MFDGPLHRLQARFGATVVIAARKTNADISLALPTERQS